MKLLITGADRALGQTAARHFSREHDVRCVGRGEASPSLAGVAYAQSDLRDPAVASSLVQGVEAVLHLEAYHAGETRPGEEPLDVASRGTYRLMHAARAAGVARVVVGSTLALLEAYAETYVVDETWQPLPRADAASLAPLMCELTAREFAREGGIEAVCVRFRPLDGLDGTPAADAVRALEEALRLELKRPGYRWALFHVCSGSRFATMMPTDPLRLQQDPD